MCGQFYVDDTTYWESQELISRIASETFQMERNMDDREKPVPKTGDIHPTEKSIIIADGTLLGRGKPGPGIWDVKWGFPSFDRKNLVINARVESAPEKKMFQDSLKSRRCIIPARHFYEWDKEKNKATFTWEKSRTLYMAGIFSCFDDEFRFCILTTKANESMIHTHDRMPLILPREQVGKWIYSGTDALNMLKQDSPLLTKFQEYEQLSLFS